MPQVQGTMTSRFNKKVNSHSFKLFSIITDELLTLTNVGEPIKKKKFVFVCLRPQQNVKLGIFTSWSCSVGKEMLIIQ